MAGREASERSSFISIKCAAAVASVERLVMLNSHQIDQFRLELLDWISRLGRKLPWRRNTDPYRVWISEIMLQQTRVAFVIPYYERFVERFPDIHELASSSEEDLLTHWAGLGYYHRARNLQRAARMMAASGGFPASFDQIRALPGVGDYTAAAIASISFQLPHAVVDGNVSRVLSRVENDATNIATSRGRNCFKRLAEKLLDRGRPGDYNQALMELGATVCVPKNPQCLVCPVSSLCSARKAGNPENLPVKVKPQKAIEEHRVLYWIVAENRLLVWQRGPESKLMPGFWELPEEGQLLGTKPVASFGKFRHWITFHKYCFEIKAALPPADLGECHWVSFERLANLPLSTVTRKAQRLVSAAARTVLSTTA
jgi:A/G-specific adenine glycosylase